ncbi:MAG: prepilin-type N-terminal cleavage/methylation domain-containing protein [Minisyncoccia bacterium]|jgi:prepilin-type N-terminal cleavage/methylation domain-containing protein
MIILSLQNNRARHTKGFTLVELLVAVALFSILMAIAAGGFVRALRSEREVSAMMAAESNVNLALEQMAREMRTGYLFCHDPGVPSPNEACASCSVVALGATQVWTCPTIEFYNASGEKVDYSLDANNVLERADSAENSGLPEPLTSDNISVTDLNFTIFGNVEGDTWNPRVTVAIGVQPNDNTVTWSTANLETTISARSIDCIPGSSPAQC